MQPPAPHPTQGPSAALIGYDGTALFHHAGDAASYAWCRLDKTAPGHAEWGFQEQARKSRSVISFACDAIMYEQYVILYYIIGPTCRGLNGHVRASLEI